MRNSTVQLYLRLVGLALLAFGLLAHATPAEARLDPFYIVHGTSYGKVVPRVLFLLDNSGSMAMDITYKPGATFPSTKCWWDNCEDEDTGVLQSRIHAAREVIAQLAAANAGVAEFGLMTFGTAAPPTQANEVPDPCESLDNGEEYRFTWVETVNQPYSTQWKPASNVFGEQGIWLLCGDNRPFPYLRHDDLGGFSLPDHSEAPLLEQPLYLTHSTADAFKSDANYSRKVQWFPRFVGRRVHLDCADNHAAAIASDTWGDYGNTQAERASAVCDRDFYYWPYVDGNPGYSFYSGKSEDNFRHQECTDNANCSTKTNGQHRLGVARRDQWTGASLYAPFYSKAVIDNPNMAWKDKGPLNSSDAATMLRGIVSKSYAGGADATGGTPMRVAMGVTEFLVQTDNQGKLLGPKPALTQSNAPFSHPTVASYLAFMRLAEDDDMCRPVSLIIVTDGQPDPWNTQGGSSLFERLRSVRRILGVKTYLVAFTAEVYDDPLHFSRIHQMACAAAGADSVPSPCEGGNTFGQWDTCADPEDPANACAWLADDHTQLTAALTEILTQALETEIPGGTPTLANDFQLADPNNPESAQAAVQTSISSWTEFPSFAGHLVRGACNDEDPDNPGQLADYCQNAADLPVDTAELESFGPCPISRVWDAGVCLQQTDWRDRRIYTHDANNNVVRVAEPNGEPSAAFIALVEELDGQGLIKPPLAVDATAKALEIKAMVELLLGRDLPGGWKLPGLPNAAPILIRRVPKADENFLPTVGIRDPHCAGRRNAIGDNVPESLEAYSAAAWELSAGGGLSDHYDYTEAVLIGDDFGVLHGFHYDSGNELFGLVPRALLNNARQLSVNGGEHFGQPSGADKHVFGVASTVNAGWAYDHDSGEWRHLAVFGLGPGGSEILTLDVSHMGRVQDDDPIEVVWTASTTGIAEQYAQTLGETWSRPALTYAVPNHQMSVEPKAYMVFGSGYREGYGELERGRTVWVVDAITGETVTERAYLPVPEPGSVYDVTDDMAAISDIAVGSHCLSRYWGEMQEAYWGDPAGRLFRWDLATEIGDPTVFPHAADSGGGKWQTNAKDFAVAVEGFRFSACQSKDEFSCAVAPIGQGGSKGELFTFSPAVVANNRIDDINSPGEILDEGDRDQFLLALVSGSPNDDAIDGGDLDNDFHSSIYLIADDHRAEPNGGFDIPGIGGVTAPGSHAHFMRLPLNQIERSRTIVYPNDTSEVETRNFSKRARPIRPPMIRVTGLADGNQQLGEVYYINYTIYEPGTSTCNSNWYDEESGEWLADPGATYEVSFRLVIATGEPFDFANGYAMPGTYGDGFGASGSLSGPKVEQVVCEGDNCGAVLRAPKSSPCDPNLDAPSLSGPISVQTGWSEIEGFAPLEVAL